MTGKAWTDPRDFVSNARRLPQSHDLHHRATDFLLEEAHLLDQRDFDKWLSLLSPDIRYRVPVRVTAVSSSQRDELLEMEHYFEDFWSLSARVKRLHTEHAWAEDPPSRTRRFVTNFRSFALDDGNVVVESYLLLYRSRGDQLSTALISAMRLDTLQVESERTRLLDRFVILDDSVLDTQNLALFL